MKLIKKGVFDPDGIYMDCQYCNAQYLIESRKDFQVSLCHDFDEMKLMVEYYITCPSCKNVRWIGPIDKDEYTCSLKHITRRADWEERYKINPEDVSE